MFKKDNYIVTLNIKDIGSFTQCAKINYIFKQSIDSEYIIPRIDLVGSTSNANDTLLYNKRGNLLDWKYATTEEIFEYERIGKPFDVTKLVPVVRNNSYDYLIALFKKLGIK